MGTREEVNILLLGETGVGKSTWINGFANFLEFETLSEAEAAPIYCLIPANFTITDEDYNQRLISVIVDGDDNEVTETGQSATQLPLSYVFRHGGKTVRLIDTPGIGDVRGLEQDKINFETILNHISHIHDLHGVCILLKPNNARLNLMFTFCINELLTHLHKDAARNIVFCFTNSRSTFYKPGDTLPALRKLLDENPEVHIPINKSTLYCMDNEAIRFVYALKNGATFPIEDRQNFEGSWNRSVQEYSRLFEHVTFTLPHRIKNTLSLNNARKLIIGLGKPLAQITQKIQTDIALAELKKIEITTSMKSKEELVKDLFITETDVRAVQLNEPRTVCTALCCTQSIKVGGIWKRNYNTHCHANCSSGKNINSHVEGVVGHPKLQRCSAFNFSGDCKTCGCHWDKHMKISYETTLESRIVKNTKLEMELRDTASNIEKIEKFVDNLELHLTELKDEQEVIKDASVQFALFLKANAITPYNDALIQYLNHYIDEEENKGKDKTVLLGLRRMREEYEKEIKSLEEAMAAGQGQRLSSVEDLNQLQENLYKLKHSGGYLESMMKISLRTAEFEYKEKTIYRDGTYVVTSTKKPRRQSKMFKKVFTTRKRGSKGDIIEESDHTEVKHQNQTKNSTTNHVTPKRELPPIPPRPNPTSSASPMGQNTRQKFFQHRFAAVPIKKEETILESRDLSPNLASKFQPLTKKPSMFDLPTKNPLMFDLPTTQMSDLPTKKPQKPDLPTKKPQMSDLPTKNPQMPDLPTKKPLMPDLKLNAPSIPPPPPVPDLSENTLPLSTSSTTKIFSSNHNEDVPEVCSTQSEQNGDEQVDLITALKMAIGKRRTHMNSEGSSTEYNEIKNVSPTPSIEIETDEWDSEDD